MFFSTLEIVQVVTVVFVLYASTLCCYSHKSCLLIEPRLRCCRNRGTRRSCELVERSLSSSTVTTRASHSFCRHVVQ